MFVAFKLTNVLFCGMFICHTKPNDKFASNHWGNHMVFAAKINSCKELTIYYVRVTKYKYQPINFYEYRR